MPNRIATGPGDTFGRLIVLNILNRRAKNGGVICECLCSCGNVKNIVAGALRRGDTVSCGCMTIENATNLGKASKKHGKSSTREYNIWVGIKSRCYNQNNPSYRDYGARGILMDIKWRNDFQAFLDDMGECPQGFMIDRVDVNSGYTKGNCRWVSSSESSENKRNSRLISINGKTVSLEKAAKLLGKPATTLRYRYSRGLSIDTGDCQTLNI